MSPIRNRTTISYDTIKSLFPVRYRQGEDFKSCLDRIIKDYVSILKQHNEDEDLIKHCTETGNQLLKIINSIGKGAHSTAFSQLTNLLENKNQKYGISLKGLLQEEEGHLYRMRIMKSRRDVDYMDLFHIPFSKRCKVKTERYSFPGLPCLYLGSSIYVCWEEMGRPDFSHVMVSALNAKKKLKLLDLRVPNSTRWRNYDKGLIPIILACQCEVRDKEADYKIEYIIPQLMMEYVLSNKKGIDGIIYSSVFRDKQFDYPVDKSYNIALPAIQEYNDKEYSNKLIELFDITRPTCEEYERLTRHIGVNDIQRTIDKTDIKQNREYEISIFREMEKSLTNVNLHPMYNLSKINNNDETH